MTIRPAVLVEGLGSGAKWYGSRARSPDHKALLAHLQKSHVQGLCVWGWAASRPVSGNTGLSSTVSAAALRCCLFRDL